MSKVVYVHMHNTDITIPKLIKQGDWIDLRSAEDVDLEQYEDHLLDLGVSIKIPEGYYAMLVVRSSAFMNYHIIQTDGIGIIDNSYCGDNDIWKLPILALRKTHISKNDRICQFTIVKKENVEIDIVDHLEGINRGGFGSTGVN